MAKQYTVAVVKDFAKSFSISAEGYYKEIFNDISLKEGSSFMQIKSIDVVDKNDLTWEDNITTGTSWNYGSEVFIHKKKGRLQGWISYTLAWSISKFKELNFGNSFLNRQDRRHSLSIMMIYRINEKWSISADWVYMTGNHITLANSIYNNIDILPENSYLESHPNYVNYEFTGINNFCVCFPSFTFTTAVPVCEQVTIYCPEPAFLIFAPAPSTVTLIFSPPPPPVMLNGFSKPL